MYTAKINRETDWSKIAAFMREFSFALIVNTDEQGVPHATHIPVSLIEKSPGNFVLQGHIAKVNPQWQYFEKNDTLIVFSAPHAYVSASWYEKDRIPTWNYMAVHIHGKTRILSEDELRKNLEQLVDHYEAASKCPVHINDIDHKYFENNLKAVVGFETTVRDINANYKLSNNKNDKDFCSVVDHLKERDHEFDARIAAEMEVRRPQAGDKKDSGIK
ncbi:FMN-binding negative transcriptional regulator [Chitinophaga sp. Cy-1792]|uniref:FMN-binding negative transcriptional regulator n=1 Tax=Chitinophaga sp. Cy-1792 TaxID=2608339 RepID=UPI00141EAFB8|nr:FMN-binding negative transcriptional regulator [Chitinophaga sp. Cy-1792]NIG57381.1 FMN-binding negative transcriptional regulator [Chitinophaga sp. Cy-1792]